MVRAHAGTFISAPFVIFLRYTNVGNGSVKMKEVYLSFVLYSFIFTVTMLDLFFYYRFEGGPSESYLYITEY